MNIYKSVLILTMTFLLSSYVQAHKDRKITLKKGKLIGLREEYQPAELNISKSRLRIKNHVMNFPSYIQKLIPTEKYKLIMSSSWYHKRSTLPPYLSIRIIPEDKDFGYDLLFDMDTLSLLELTVIIHQKGSSQYFPIKLNKLLLEDINSSITTIK